MLNKSTNWDSDSRLNDARFVLWFIKDFTLVSCFLFVILLVFLSVLWSSGSRSSTALSCYHTVPKVKIIKGIVSVISNDHPYRDGNARFTTVPSKLCAIKDELDIHVFCWVSHNFNRKWARKQKTKQLNRLSLKQSKKFRLLTENKF